MSDFVSQLAERAMGTAPVVQPLIPSIFAQEPAGHLTGPEGEPAPEDPYRAPRPQTPPDTPTHVPDEAGPQNQEPDTDITPPPSAPDTVLSAPSSQAPPSGQEDLDAPEAPGPPLRQRAADEPGPLETGMESMQEGRQTLSSIPPKSLAPRSGPRRESRNIVAEGRTPLSELRFEPAPRVESSPARRDVEEAPQQLVPKDAPSNSFVAEQGQAMLRPAMLAQVATEAPAPPSRSDGLDETSEVTPMSEIVRATSATQRSATVVVPRIVPHQPGQQEETGPRETSVPAPEPPAPTIKVAIGRIEVRAVTLPAPARREAPARPGPLLSLDEYLEQSNGGHR
jgi:hypothetical protein